MDSKLFSRSLVVKLAKLHIDRFGARSELKLDELSDQLNIVYGPNGSGKSTIISFLRWILYGQEDMRSRGYLQTGHVPAGGQLTILESGRPHILQRRNDSVSGGRLADLNGHFSSPPQLAPVGLAEFDAIFSYDYEQPRDFPRLLDVAKAHGFNLEFDERQQKRIQELNHRIIAHRDALHRLPGGGESPEQLRRHRSEKVAEIDAIHHQQQLRRGELDRLRHELSQGLHEAGQRAEGLRAVVSDLDAAIQIVRQGLAEESHQWQQAREQAAQKNRQHAEELNAQVHRWQEVLSQIRQRLDQLRSRRTLAGPVQAPTPGDVELQSFLQSLGFRIRDIEHDLGGISGSGRWLDEKDRDQDADVTYYRGLLGSALASMRDDMSRLCQTIDRQSHALEHQQLQEELQLLGRCETELTELVDRLTERRQGIRQSAADWAADDALPPYSYPADSYPAEARRDARLPSDAAPPPWPASDPLALSEDLSGPLPLETPRAVYQHRGSHLQERREAAVRRVHEAEARIRELEHRLRDADAELARQQDDSQITRLQQEVRYLDDLLLAGEQRARLMHTIGLLEDEVRTLREHLDQSEVVDTASAYLQRLTEGSYRRLRIHDTRRVTVEDHAARAFDISQLSRGIGDLTYASLGLALVEAYRRRGIELPFVVHDSFDNVDTSGTRQLVSLLAEISQRGCQVLLFTRHEHVLDMFRGLPARLFSLRPRGEAASRPGVPVAGQTEQLRGPLVYLPPVGQPSSVDAPPPATPTYRWVAEWHDRHHYPTSGPPGAASYEFTAAAPTAASAEAPLVPTFPPPVEQPTRRVTDSAEKTAAAAREASDRSTTVAAPAIAPRIVVPPSADEPVAPVAAESPAVSKLLHPFTEADSLRDVPTLSADFITLLEGLGLRSVGDFLEVSPAEAASLLLDHGVTSEIVERRQREILLQSHVGVTPDESRLLVACGVPDPERLARADEGVLLRRIETLLDRPQTQSRFGSIDQYSLARVRRWIDSARRSSYRQRAYRAWTPPVRGDHAPRATRQASSFAARSADRLMRQEANPERGKEDKSGQAGLDDTVRFQSRPGLRFYLEPQHPVVDAPSIGSKMAKRLERCEIRTVADLLSCVPEELAAELDDGRIGAELILAWQRQARLACCIPNLRAHDAQILVACDIWDAAMLSSQEASQLLPKVLEFSRTSEGKRVLRNGKEPDLQEVTAWIEWAGHARQLKAA